MSQVVTATPTSDPVDHPATAPRCDGCNAVLYDGRCLAVGFCPTADATATRSAARTTAKYQPAAWTMSGGVD